MSKYYFVYILANNKNGTLYIGVSSNILKRIWIHKQKYVKGFTCKYSVTKLVFYEVFEDINLAIKREKQLKKWNREWKIRLIENYNPKWEDLYYSL